MRGFSLVELMVVVAIIGILSALAIPRFRTFQVKARQAEAKTNLSQIYTLEELYFAEEDTYANIDNIGFGDCTLEGNEEIVFMPNPCSETRYWYAVAIDADGLGYEAEAHSPGGQEGHVNPGCAASDIWKMDEEKCLCSLNDSTRNCDTPGSFTGSCTAAGSCWTRGTGSDP